MSAKPILYYNILSPPSRAVLLVAADLGVELDLKNIDLLGLEHKGKEYVSKFPQHSIPGLEDNGFYLADSHAICAYLSEKYGDSDRLYPKDLKKRALVDSRLHFDSGHAFCRLRFIYEPILYNKSKEMPEDRIKYFQVLWDILDKFVENSPYMCGNEMTIADLCLMATVSSIDDIAPPERAKHGNVVEWMHRMSQLPYYHKINAAAAKDLQVAVRAILKKNQEL